MFATQNRTSLLGRFTIVLFVALFAGGLGACSSKRAKPSMICKYHEANSCQPLTDHGAAQISQNLVNPLKPQDGGPAEQSSTWELSKDRRKPGVMMKLSEITLHTLRNSPEVGIYGARSEDAFHGVRIAKSDYQPKVSMRATTGPEANMANRVPTSRGHLRSEASVKMSVLLWDFGGTSNKVNRAKQLYSSAQYRLVDKAEAVVLDIAEAYLQVMEQARYIANARQNIKAHDKFYKLVKANAGEGNGTQADVERAFSRLEHARTQAIDFETARQEAVGKFRRISGLEPGKLKMPPAFHKEAQLDRSVIAALLDKHPRLLAIKRDSESLRAQIKSQKSTYLPTVALEGETGVTRNVSGPTDTLSSARGMVVMKWSLFDGGRRFAIGDQLVARLKENEYRYRKQYNELEEDLMEAIRTMRTAKKKATTINQQVASSEKVAKLYMQQFTVGKKRLLEVLDAQKDLFSVRRDRIANDFEKLRANYRALRLKGRLVPTITGKTRIVL